MSRSFGSGKIEDIATMIDKYVRVYRDVISDRK